VFDEGDLFVYAEHDSTVFNASGQHSSRSCENSLKAHKRAKLLKPY
jgi:hypothetical protein